MDFWIKIQSSDWTSPYFYDPNLNTRFLVDKETKREKKEKTVLV